MPRARSKAQQRLLNDRVLIDVMEDILFTPERWPGSRLERLERFEGSREGLGDGGPRRDPDQGAAARPFSLVGSVVKPPGGITGDTSKVSIGNLRFALPFSCLGKVRLQLDAWLGAGQDLEYGMHGYGATRRWENGAMMSWAPEVGGWRRPEYLVVLDQSFLERLSFEQLREVCCFFALVDNYKCTRVDLTLDVSRELLSVDRLRKAIERDEFCGFKRAGMIQERVKGRGVDNNGVSFGRRGKKGSGRYLRAYDKFLESDGEIDATRLELECTKTAGVAGVFFGLLCQSLRHGREAFQFFVAEQVTNNVDFRVQKGKNSSKSRTKRCGWWAKVVSVGSKATIESSYVKKKFVDQFKGKVVAAQAACAALVECVRISGADHLAAVDQVVAMMVRAGDSVKARSLAERFVNLGGDVSALLPGVWHLDEIPF